MKKLEKKAVTTLIAIIMILTLLPVVSAATIKGSVYDIFLDEINKAIVTIDTEPEQISISKDGSYLFNVPPGEYTIIATYYTEGDVYGLEEQITIKEEGDYNIDLILAPSLGEELSEEDIIGFEDFEVGEPSKFGLVITIMAMLTIVLYFHFSKHHFIKEPKESDIKGETEEQLDNLVDYIKSEGGRATQKQIRKKFPSSEAKISLMITELEAKGIIKKIKKGRGNIIILQKQK
tara:strand:+ start:2666 stop:3367 length:702 start_codon:yes stop_codon:yes gene_type:complete